MNRHCLSVQPPVQSRFRPNSVSATSVWQVNGAVAFPRVWSSSVARLRRMVLVTVPSPYQRKQETARICLHWLSCLCRCSHNAQAATRSGSYLVWISDISHAILGFQLFPRLVGAAGLDGNWCLPNSGEGDQGSISLHVTCSARYVVDQVLTELESVNRNRNGCRNAIAGHPS